MTILEDIKSGRLAVVPPVSVKPLEWQSSAWNHRSADIYVIEDMGANWSHDRFWLAAHGILDNVGLGKFGTLDAAKAAAQADYEVRIISALAASPDHTTALLSLVEGMEREIEKWRKADEVWGQPTAYLVDCSFKAEKHDAAEAKVEALREALAALAETTESLAGRIERDGGRLDLSGPAQDLAQVDRLLPRARALTQEQNNG